MHEISENGSSKWESMQFEMPETVTFWLTSLIENCEEDLLMMVADLVTAE